MKRGEDIDPIPGTKKIEKLEENLKAAEAKLDDEEEAEIRKFVEGNEMDGYRSTPVGGQMTYVDTEEEA